jgi:cytochrome c peroxidase
MMKMVGIRGLLLVCVAASCRSAPYRVVTPLGLDVFAPVPESNPLSRGSVALGKRLFFDALLSADRSVSCASCHQPGHAFSDTVAHSLGAHGRSGRRNAPSLLNAAYRSAFFWDGRAASLEEQVLQPIEDTLEMDVSLDDLERRLRGQADYRTAFRHSFGDPTRENVARALASYVRSLRSGDAPIDRFRHGDTTALAPLARRGYELFVGRAGCTHCHVGPLFTDDDFHNTGVAVGSADVGRFAVTREERDRGRFRTPSLRNVARTAPYMHDGSLRTLDQVIEFYSGGGRANPNLDPLVRPLRLTADERQALVAFLESLSSGTVDGRP